MPSIDCLHCHAEDECRCFTIVAYNIRTRGSAHIDSKVPLHSRPALFRTSNLPARIRSIMLGPYRGGAATAHSRSYSGGRRTHIAAWGHRKTNAVKIQIEATSATKSKQSRAVRGPRTSDSADVPRNSIRPAICPGSLYEGTWKNGKPEPDLRLLERFQIALTLLHHEVY